MNDYYVIKIQPSDELTVVIDKIVNTQADKIYLLVSENSRIAQHVLNFRLIKREADTVSKDVIVVSSSPQVQGLALKASLQAHSDTSDFREYTKSHIGEDHIVSAKRMSDVSYDAAASKLLTQGIIKKKLATPKDKERVTVQIDSNPTKGVKNLSSSAPVIKMEEAKEKALTRMFSRDSKIRNIPLPKPKILKPTLKPIRLLPKLKFFSVLSGSMGARGTLFVLVILAFVAGVGTFYYILPTASVRVVPVTEEIMLEMTISGDVATPASSLKDFAVRAQVFEQSVASKKNINATGEVVLEDRARGEIKIFNAFSSSPQTLVASTRFVSEDGKLFRTAKTIVVPGARVDGGEIIPEFIVAEIIAAEAGEEYNITPSKFSIPGFKGTSKYLGFYGESDIAMSGGRIGKATVVSEDDYRTAMQEVEAELELQANNDISILLFDDLIIPAGAYSISPAIIKSTHEVGSITDEFILDGELTVRAFAISKNDVEDLLIYDFMERFPGKEIVDDGSEFEYKVLSQDYSKGTIEFMVNVQKIVYLTIDPAKIKRAISGKDEAVVRNFLGSQPNIKESSVTFRPFWAKKMPSDDDKIEIKIVDFVTTMSDNDSK